MILTYILINMLSITLSVSSGGFRQPPRKPVHNVENRYSNKPLNCTNLVVTPDILKDIVVFCVGQHQTHYLEALL